MSLRAGVVVVVMGLATAGCVFAAVGPVAMVVPAALVAAGATKLATEGQAPDGGELLKTARREASALENGAAP